MQSSIIRVLVVDDSAFARKTLRQLLEMSPHIEVVGTARDGIEALEQVAEVNPDVITLDLNMPNLDGLGFLRKLMASRPIPTLVVSTASADGEQVIDALDAGAVDFIHKPTGLATDRLREIGRDLIDKVKVVAQARPVEPASDYALADLGRSSASVETTRYEGLVIGCSTGGPQALRALIPRLPADLPVGIAVVLHMPVGFTQFYAERLNTLTALDVREASEGDRCEPGRVLIAPAGRHLVLVRSASLDCPVAHLDARPFESLHRPSVDVLFSSAARAYGSRTLGVILTGMGADGTVGAERIHAARGRILAEAEESCVVYGMPRSAVEAGFVDRVVPLDRMAEAIVKEVVERG